MYGALLAFAIAIVIVSIGLAASRADARGEPPKNFWLGTMLLFVAGVALIGVAASGLAS